MSFLMLSLLMVQKAFRRCDQLSLFIQTNIEKNNEFLETWVSIMDFDLT
jgi:hypothetical protein